MTWNRMKWIALISMVIDHVGKAFPVQRLLMTYFGMDMPASAMITNIIPIVGRIAFPIYAYGVAQGCMYTHNSRKHLLRLLVFALISELPFNLALQYGSFTFGLNNVFFTLFLGALCCYIYKYFKSKSKVWISVFPILFLVFFAEIAGCDYKGFGIIMIIVPYIFFSNKNLSVLALGITTAIFYAFYANFNWSSMSWLSGNNFFWVFQLVSALFGVFLLFVYNGQKGKSKNKLFFYICYPGHLILLYLLSMVITY